MRIELDIHEYSVLIEAAWGAGTALRTGIMHDAIDHWFHQLHPRDAAHLHRFFSERMKRYPVAEEEQEHFLRRHDPDNQYLVTAKTETHHCYLVDGKYHVAMRAWMDPHQITHIRKLHLGVDWELEVNILRDQQVRAKKAPPCPLCGEKMQVQIINSLARPAAWRCRKCKTYFEQEP